MFHAEGWENAAPRKLSLARASAPPRACFRAVIDQNNSRSPVTLMKRSLPFLLPAFLLFAGSLRAEPTANELFSSSIRKLAAVFDAKAADRTTLRTTIEVLAGEALPKELQHAKLDVAISAPDRLRIGTLIDKERIEAGRIGQELWVWAPGKRFGVRAVQNVPRFAGDPSTIDQTALAPLELPLDPLLLEMLPRLFETEYRERATIDGESCRVVVATPLPRARELLSLPAMTLTLWLRDRDALPAKIAYRGDSAASVEIGLKGLRLEKRGSAKEWQIPSAKGAKIERVALSHLANFFQSAIALLDSKAPKLGPATGARSVLASHGAGRLELHDETRVLFLKGTPEEMGEQHGKLMKKQVNDLVRRVLYGVGIGSSFAKGRWFFGEIESCTARIGKFIDPRYLREMDALAAASGQASQEIRLANFFPELFHCSGFALTGDATTGGRIFHGRILDYMKGIGLERNAVVTVHQPDEGHAWVNIGYAGFVGTVTAMNEKQISIGEMGGRGEGNWDGKPMAQLLREIMEKAATLDEAVAIMRQGPRTCEYYYVIADGKSKQAVGIKATPDIFEVVKPGEAHPQLETPIPHTVLLSAGDRYQELARRVQAGFGKFDAESARQLMTRPVSMSSNIHSVLFAPDTLDFWVANADAENVASHARYTKYNLTDLLRPPPAVSAAPPSR